MARKKILMATLLAALIIGCTLSAWAEEDVDYTDTSYWMERCVSDQIQGMEDYQACEAYREYVKSTSESLQGTLASLDTEKEAISENLAMYGLEIEQYRQESKELSNEISALQAKIDDNEVQIATLQLEVEATERGILAKEEELSDLKEKVKDRISFYQVNMRLNSYADVLLGAKTFGDLLRIVAAFSSVTQFDNRVAGEIEEAVAALDDAKEALNQEQSQLVVLTNEIAENKESLENKRNDVLAKQYLAEMVQEEYEKQQAELEARSATVVADMEDIVKKMNSISDELDNVPDSVLHPEKYAATVISETFAESGIDAEVAAEAEAAVNAAASQGWIYPVPGAVRSAGTWAYSSGYVHLGYDFAAPIGTRIRAVGNGVILKSSDGCPTYGYIGCQCGGSGSPMGGNQVYLLTKVNGSLYAVKYLHMELGSPIAQGSIVNAGDVIGRVGTSGNSSGAHCHIEIFYLGSADLFTTYATTWNGDLSFGCGWGTAALARRCSSGVGAPCRLRPEDIFGY